MSEILSVYEGAKPLIGSVIRREMALQGHHLSGEMEDSVDAETYEKGKADYMDGVAVDYTQFVNTGLPAQSASFKQVPYLVAYFKDRGYSEKEATSFAFATVKKWMKEGMPTQASKRFSKTGSRTNMIENALFEAEPKIDEYMTSGFDFVVEERFQKEKSETI